MTIFWYLVEYVSNDLLLMKHFIRKWLGTANEPFLFIEVNFYKKKILQMQKHGLII